MATFERKGQGGQQKPPEPSHAEIPPVKQDPESDLLDRYAKGTGTLTEPERKQLVELLDYTVARMRNGEILTAPQRNALRAYLDHRKAEPGESHAKAQAIQLEREWNYVDTLIRFSNSPVTSTLDVKAKARLVNHVLDKISKRERREYAHGIVGKKLGDQPMGPEDAIAVDMLMEQYRAKHPPAAGAAPLEDKEVLQALLTEIGKEVRKYALIYPEDRFARVCVGFIMSGMGGSLGVVSDLDAKQKIEKEGAKPNEVVKESDGERLVDWSLETTEVEQKPVQRRGAAQPVELKLADTSGGAGHAPPPVHAAGEKETKAKKPDEHETPAGGPPEQQQAKITHVQPSQAAVKALLLEDYVREGPEELDPPEKRQVAQFLDGIIVKVRNKKPIEDIEAKALGRWVADNIGGEGITLPDHDAKFKFVLAWNAATHKLD